MNAPAAVVQLRGVTKRFGPQTVLDGINLDIPEHQTTVIMGLSGAGKSVTLKHMIGLLKPDSGQVFVDGDDITALEGDQIYKVRLKFGFLFQDGALLDSMSVSENVALPLKEHSRLSRTEIRDRVEEVLGQVGLQGMGYKAPSELSGGMRKRAGLARAMVLRPRILLLDEPSSGLDPVMTDVIMALINELQSQYKTTNVVISHDVEATYKIAHRIAMLYKGRIHLEGTADNLKSSTDPLVRQFLDGHREGPITL